MLFFLEFVVVSDTLEIGVDVLSCYGIIMSLLMAEDYVLQGGCGERILKNATYLLFVIVK